MAEKTENVGKTTEKVDENELVKIFTRFWVQYGEKEDAKKWKNINSDGKKVVDTLETYRNPGITLRNCTAYLQCLDKWSASNQKNNDNDNGVTLDESKVSWGDITNTHGVCFFLCIRDWPNSMLCEEFLHTRQFVLNNIDSKRDLDGKKVDGLFYIMGTAKKNLGLAKDKKELKEDAKDNSVGGKEKEIQEETPKEKPETEPVEISKGESNKGDKAVFAIIKGRTETPGGSYQDGAENDGDGKTGEGQSVAVVVGKSINDVPNNNPNNNPNIQSGTKSLGQ